MSDQTPTDRQDDTSGTKPASPEVARIEADLEQTRDRLAETVDALGAKLDVKTRTTEKVTELREERGTEIAVAAGTVVALLVVLVVWRRRR